MKRVLVSGASGVVGYGVLRSLRHAKSSCLLIGTSIYADSVTPAFSDVFELAPPTEDSGYIEWLLATISRHKIDLLIPGIEIDMYHWAEHRLQIEETGAKTMLNEPGLISLCKDKWSFYERMVANKLDCVIETSLDNDFHVLASNFGVPFLLKPRRGFASKGIVRVGSNDIFALHRADVGPRLMAQPIVGNDEEEFTTSAFCDGAGGYFAIMTLRRKLSRDGFTDRAEVVDSEPFEAAIISLCKLLNPVGPTNFQFRLTERGPKLLEINPRISSSTSIRTAFGYNESAMALDYFLESREPRQPTIRRGRAVRYIDEKIFYEDSVHI